MSNVSLVNGHIDRPKMTDEEVIKALECCFLSECDCKDCPYSELEICDTAKMINTVIDLTNRQKAEIEKKDIEIDILIRKNETLKDEIAELKVENEREFQPKQGKWLINPDGYYPYCSECKEEPKGRIMTKFCPECGADMRGEKNEQI